MYQNALNSAEYPALYQVCPLRSWFSNVFSMKSFYIKLISVLQSESETGLQKSQKINEKYWNEAALESKSLRFKMLDFLRNACFFSIRTENRIY